MPQKSFWTRYQSYLIPILSVILTALIVALKFQSYRSWQYTSDLFIYDAFLREMVFQNQLVDFTYGNLFGDHAYLFLFLFYPLKLLLGNNFVYLLLAFNPVLFLVSILLIHRVLVMRIGTLWAMLGSMSYLAGYGLLYRGLLEGIYGFHPDLGSGFVLISLTCLELLLAETDSKKVWVEIPIYALSLFYFSYKEEMAILGGIFYLILFVATRKRRFAWMTGVALAVIAGDFILIKESQTVFNRSNTALLSTVFQGIGAEGFNFLFKNPQGPQINVLGYWGFLTVSVTIFHLRWFITKARDPYLLALFFTGLINMGSSLLLRDFRLTSWHNLPGVFIIITVFTLEILPDSHSSKMRFHRNLIDLLALSLLLMTVFESPLIAHRIWDNIKRKPTVASYAVQIRELRELVPEDRVLSVPMFSLSEFTDSRVISYPGGVITAPAGIADYVIMPRKVSHVYTGNFDMLYLLEHSASSFELLKSTKNFRIFQRTGLDLASMATRELFFTEMNLPELILLP